jgi:AsmA protein
MRRRLAWGLGLLVGLPALAIAAFLVLFDANALRPRLIAEVERATGRAFTVREMGVALSLRPALELRGVSLANIPGGSRPEMLRAERVAVQLALLPLLSRQIELVSLVIEQPDLLLEPDAEGRGNWLFARPVAPAGAPAGPPGAPRERMAIALDSLTLVGGRIAWRSGPAAATEILEIATLTASAPLAGPARIAARGTARGETFTVEATTGPLMALGGPTPWPVTAQIGVAGLSATLGLELAEAPRSFTLRMGAADLAAWRPGLRLAALEASAANLSAPMQLRASGSFEGMPVAIEGQLGTPGLLIGAAPGQLAFDLAVEVVAMQARLRGTAGREAGSMFMALDDLRIAGPALEASGALRLRAAPRPSLVGRLEVARLDLDALRPAAAPARAPAAAPSAPPAAAPTPTRMIPSLPIPFAALRVADAELDLRIAAFTAEGATTRDIATRLVVAEGKGRLDPLTATTPAGALALRIEADATATPPSLRIRAQSPALDMAMLTAALGMEPWLLGAMQLDADLRGVGNETRGWAGTLAGHLGLTLVDGALSRDALRRIPQAVLDALAPGGLPPGDIPVRCFALRAPAEAGVLRLTSFHLDGALGTLGGGGTVDLGQENLALRLMADLRAGRVAVRAPVNIVGPWRAPRVGVDPAGAVAAGIGALLSRQRSPDRTLQGLAEALGGGRGGGGGECEAALAAARGGVAGPLPR